jgi:hypothetical protein
VFGIATEVDCWAKTDGALALGQGDTTVFHVDRLLFILISDQELRKVIGGNCGQRSFQEAEVNEAAAR